MTFVNSRMRSRTFDTTSNTSPSRCTKHHQHLAKTARLAQYLRTAKSNGAGICSLVIIPREGLFQIYAMPRRRNPR